MAKSSADTWRKRALSHGRHTPVAAASFVSELRRIEQVLAQAEAHAAAQHYAQARAQLLPHLGQLPELLVGPVYLLLGRCAMHGCGRDWQGALLRARRAYQAAEDPTGLARVRLCLGEAWAAKGDFEQAQMHLRSAVNGLLAPHNAPVLACAQRLQAEVSLWQNALEPAQNAAQAAVLIWATRHDGVEEAMARLIRAQVAATAGHTQAAAHDMLWAERLVSSSASATAKLRVGLARAESLLWMTCPHRATAGLLAMQDAVQQVQSRCMQAHYQRLLGRSQVVDAPSVAHSNLGEAAAAFADMGQTYYLAQCQLGLVRCEHRLHIPTQPRLKVLGGMNFAHWPILQAELEAVRQQLAQAPGRLTGPQPPRKFYEGDAWVSRKTVSTHETDAPGETDDSAKTPARSWLTRLQAMFSHQTGTPLRGGGAARQAQQGQINVHDLQAAPALTQQAPTQGSRASELPEEVTQSVGVQATARAAQRRLSAYGETRQPAAQRAEITRA